MNIQLNINKIYNPYFKNINYVDLNILKNIVKDYIDFDANTNTYKIRINNFINVNLLYHVIYSNPDLYIDNKNIKKQYDIIDKLTNKNIIIPPKIYFLQNNQILNTDETTRFNILINEYINEKKRILKIFNIFLNKYFNGTKYKTSHLKNDIRKRKHTTSKCDLYDFVQKLKNIPNCSIEINNFYNKILDEHKLPFPCMYNNTYLSICLLLIKIYCLFKHYLDIIDYCIDFITLNPLVFRDFNNFLFKLETNKYIYEDNNTIYINHMNSLLNVKINEQKCDFIKLYSTPKQVNIVFTHF